MGRRTGSGGPGLVIFAGAAFLAALWLFSYFFVGSGPPPDEWAGLGVSYEEELPGPPDPVDVLKRLDDIDPVRAAQSQVVFNEGDLARMQALAFEMERANPDPEGRRAFTDTLVVARQLNEKTAELQALPVDPKSEFNAYQRQALAADRDRLAEQYARARERAAELIK
ncbi:MAG: hypothetical protein HY719_14550 [Planctomycetes bacterium]|nr:hypothetical protein [Planctomycetota bacterium]